ncbi:hypothetical protein CCR75_004938 [Bremia lactucae]|uniref:Uncharacterized protein n=1 Tax=Bremia lactucae TaxID=4779 RepID=A0A976FIQ6_BRELC|nr:hypothetical protein CCR75_004938 [Bremia lactucae]
METFLVNELIDGFNSFMCSKKRGKPCSLDMVRQFTTIYTINSLDFFQHMLFPFITIGNDEQCSAWSGYPYTDTPSQGPAQTINFGCCIKQMRPFVQTIQKAFKYVVSDDMWDIARGMVSLKSPNGTFVDSLSKTTLQI